MIAEKPQVRCHKCGFDQPEPEPNLMSNGAGNAGSTTAEDFAAPQTLQHPDCDAHSGSVITSYQFGAIYFTLFDFFIGFGTILMA